MNTLALGVASDRNNSSHGKGLARTRRKRLHKDSKEKRSIVQEIGNQIFGGKHRPPSDKDEADQYKKGWDNDKKNRL